MYDPVAASKALNLALYGAEKPVQVKTPQAYWSCTSCGLHEALCTQGTAMALADVHDKEHHKGKPMSAFGVLWV